MAEEDTKETETVSPLVVYHGCPNSSPLVLNRISGPISISIFQFEYKDIQYTFQMFGDHHESLKRICETPCNPTTNHCMEVTNYIAKLAECSEIPTHVFLEDGFRPRHVKLKLEKDRLVGKNLRQITKNHDMTELSQLYFKSGANVVKAGPLLALRLLGARSYRKKQGIATYFHYTDFRINEFTLLGTTNLEWIRFKRLLAYYSDQDLIDWVKYIQSLLDKREQTVKTLQYLLLFSDHYIDDIEKYLPRLAKLTTQHPNEHVRKVWLQFFMAESTEYPKDSGKIIHKIRKEVLQTNDVKIKKLLFYQAAHVNTAHIEEYKEEYNSWLQEVLQDLNTLKDENKQHTTTGECQQLLLECHLYFSASDVFLDTGKYVDIYTLARCFKTFDIDKHPAQSKQIIMYYGEAHVVGMIQWLSNEFKLKWIITKQAEQLMGTGRNRCITLRSNDVNGINVSREVFL